MTLGRSVLKTVSHTATSLQPLLLADKHSLRMQTEAFGYGEV